MNAAAKAIHQSNIFSGSLTNIQLSAQAYLLFCLLLLVLVSSFTVIYVTNEHRLAFSRLEQLEDKSHQLKIQWSQLLLEKASLKTSSHIEQIAINKLNMHMPSPKETFLLSINK